MPQRQDSTYDQLRSLVQLANKNGLYDAADWLIAELDRWEKSWFKGKSDATPLRATGSKRGYAPDYTETGVIPEGATEQAKKHFYKERPVIEGRAKQCMDCGYIGVPNRQGGCAKCQSAAVTDKIYVGKEGSVVKTAYVSHVPGHKNSEGESAPWVVKQHNTGKILTSYKSEAEAKAGLKNMESHKGSADDPMLQCRKCHQNSKQSDRNNLQCPRCGGSMNEPEEKEASVSLTAKFLQKK